MTEHRTGLDTPVDTTVVEVTTVATGQATAAQVARLGRVLSAEERARADRFVRHKHHDLYTVAHALVRLVLTRHGSTAAGDWRFDVGAHGCPSVVPE